MRPALEHYYDPQDMTICVSGSTSMRELSDVIKPDGLFYPLIHDSELSVAGHIRSHSYCSNSFMYGSQADNILGLNVKINNKLFKVGGRTVKNCTGFDFTRFFCNSTFDDIEMVDVVLRLRAAKPEDKWYQFQGQDEDLKAFRKEVMRSPWSYEILAFDFHQTKDSLIYFIHVSYFDGQEHLFDSYFNEVAQRHSLSVIDDEAPQQNIKHDFSIKTTISDLQPRMSRLLKQGGGHAHGYCGSGYALVSTEMDRISLNDEEVSLSELGGHISSLGHVPSTGLISNRLSLELIEELEKLA